MDYPKNFERKSRGLKAQWGAQPAPAAWKASNLGALRGLDSLMGSDSVNEFWDRICVKPRRKLVMLGGTMRASQKDSPPRLRYSFRSQKAMDVVKTRTQLTTTLCKWVFPHVGSTMVAIVLLVLATLSVGSAERHSIVPVLPPRAAGRSQNALEIIAEDPAAVTASAEAGVLDLGYKR